MNPVTAEQYLISASLFSFDTAVEAAALLPDAGQMSDGRHRLIWSAVLELLARRMRPDYVLVKEVLRSKGQLDIVTDDYLINMPFVGSSSVDDYARVIQDAATERSLYEAVEAARALALDPRRTVEEKLQAVQQRIMDVALAGSAHEMQSIGALMTERRKRLERHEAILGVSTGLRDLDEYSGGLPKTELIILASRPGVGKSSAGKTMGMHVAEQSGPVAFFSLEMSAEEIELRTSAEMTGIDSTKIRRALLRQQELEQFKAAEDRAQRIPFFISYNHTTVPAMRQAAMSLRAQQGDLALIVVDYVQLVKTTERDGSSRQQEIGKVTRALKAMAMELDVPVLAMAQLSRKAEESTDERPRLMHLRESGDIENDANQVWFLHRTKAMGNDAILIVEKNRNGMTGDLRLHWHGPTMTYRAAAYREADYD